jgi:hypothetical protein
LRIGSTPDVLERYRAAVGQWKADIEQACSEEDSDYVEMRTDLPFESLVLHRLYEAGVVA